MRIGNQLHLSINMHRCVTSQIAPYQLFCAVCSGRVSTWTGVADAGRMAGAISGQQHHRPQPPRRWRMHCRLKPQRRQVGHITVLNIFLHQELDMILQMCLRLRFLAASLGLERHMLQAVEWPC